MPKPPQDIRRLCVHYITTRPLSFEQILTVYPRAGIGALTVWRGLLEGRKPKSAGLQLQEAGLEITTLCRGGFFPTLSQTGRQQALDGNYRTIDEAAELGAPAALWTKVVSHCTRSVNGSNRQDFWAPSKSRSFHNAIGPGIKQSF